MNLPIDPELVKSVASAAILKLMDDETRNVVFQAAIQHLISPDATSRYGRMTPLQEAFNNAMQNVARKVAEEMILQDDTMKSKIRSLLDEALLRVMDTNREQTISRISDAIVKGLAYQER